MSFVSEMPAAWRRALSARVLALAAAGTAVDAIHVSLDVFSRRNAAPPAGVDGATPRAHAHKRTLACRQTGNRVLASASNPVSLLLFRAGLLALAPPARQNPPRPPKPPLGHYSSNFQAIH